MGSKSRIRRHTGSSTNFCDHLIRLLCAIQGLETGFPIVSRIGNWEVLLARECTHSAIHGCHERQTFAPLRWAAKLLRDNVGGRRVHCNIFDNGSIVHRRYLSRNNWETSPKREQEGFRFSHAHSVS